MNFQSVKVLPFTFIIVLSRNDFPQKDKKIINHPKGESFVIYAKTLKIDGFCDFQLKPL